MANCALSNDAIVAYVQGRVAALKKQNIKGPYKAILPVGANLDGPFNDSGPDHALSTAEEQGTDPSLPPQEVLNRTLREQVLAQEGVTEVEISPDKNGVEVQPISGDYHSSAESDGKGTVSVDPTGGPAPKGKS